MTYRPVKSWLTGFLLFIRDNSIYWKIWLALWAFYFNLFTIVLEFFAYYLYFVVSFDFINLYRQVYKLFIDLSAVFTFIPLWAWVIIALALLDRFRKKIAYNRLNHFEQRNRGFINARHVGDCGRFLFSHCAAHHVNDRAGVDETAVALLFWTGSAKKSPITV